MIISFPTSFDPRERRLKAMRDMIRYVAELAAELDAYETMIYLQGAHDAAQAEIDGDPQSRPNASAVG